MALQTAVTFPTGVIAHEAYTVIMAAQINRSGNCIEAEVHVYYDIAARMAGYDPLKRFLYKVEDNAVPAHNTELWINKLGAGEISVTHNHVELAHVDVAEEDSLQDIADKLQAELANFEVTVEHDEYIYLQAINELREGAGVGIDIQGEAIAVINWVVGNDGKASCLDTYFSINALSQEGINLQSQLYEHIKANDTRYTDAIDA